MNKALLTDFYELTMANGYLKNGLGERISYFDLFYRSNPDGAGFAIAAGLQQLIEFLDTLHFEEEDLQHLKKHYGFDETFIQYLRDFKFTCDVWAIPEGTPVFPSEPIITVRGPAIQAQFIETMALLLINHQSLIATKANRIVRAARGRKVVEFGSRRAQGSDGALLGARAAYIGGCHGTACVLADKIFGIPASGTMAHSWVQMFDTEYEAFKAYAEIYPEHCTLLVDTYNVLQSGIPNAIKTFDEVLAPKGCRPKGIRIDSGDIAYLSIKARQMLDAAGYEDCTIVASNALDEYLIRDLINQDAAVDMFGVGERLITSKSDPVFGGVYKLVAVNNEQGEVVSKIKLSENVGKITNPGFKTVWRLYDKLTGKAIADVLTMADEVIDDSVPYELFDPQFTWKRKTLKNFTARKLHELVYDQGKRVYESPDVHTIRNYCREEVSKLWEEVQRFENPHKYYVDLSDRLWNEKNRLLAEHALKGS